jgi:hypothetical protein
MGYVLGVIGGGFIGAGITYGVLERRHHKRLEKTLQGVNEHHMRMQRSTEAHYETMLADSRRHVEELAGSIMLHNRGALNEDQLRHDADEVLDNIYPLVRPRVERHVYGDIGPEGQYPSGHPG